ncbi:MAG TPA: glycosyl hydrolase family 18 protein [Thermoanaerobaculia bacterium]
MTRPLMTAYINPATSKQFRDVAGYTLANGDPAINVACIFAANYASPELPYLRANNNDPPTTEPFNANIQQVLSDGSVQYLQQKGLKVLLTVGNGWSQVGWSQFTSESDAMNFAQYLRDEVVGPYGLDGIDVDDEYSQGTPNETSLIMVTTLMKQIMPDKMITKALWTDQQYFQSDWNGKTLAANLTYGWEMGYGGSPQARLVPYTQFAPGHSLTPAQLSPGFWANQPSSAPDQDVEWLLNNGYAGAMIFAFEEQSNIDLMGQLVNDWYGPGNWNPPESSAPNSSHTRALVPDEQP